MMNVPGEEPPEAIDVSYVARLARIALTKDEEATFQGQLEDILDYVHKISSLNLEKVPPTSHPYAMSNVLRDDVVKLSADHDQVMANAPAHVKDQFSVPKIVE